MSSAASDERLRQVLDLLERLRSLRRGRGGDPALTRLDAAAGHSRGHLRRQLKGQIKMSAEDLFRAFELLGTEPEELLAAARQGRAPLDLWLGEMAREDRDQLRLLKVKRSHVAPSDLEAALGELSDRLRRGEQGDFDTGPLVAAVTELEEEVGEEAEELCFRTWDVLGAAFRSSGHYSASAQCFRRALALAREQPLRQAQTLRRACYLGTDQCEFEAALGFVGEAQALYLHHFRLPDIGRAWIDGGITLQKMGAKQDAAQRFEAGLHLVAEDQLYCIAAWQGIGLQQAWDRHLPEARESLVRAQAVYQGMPAGLQQAAGLHWLAAEIALADGDALNARVLLERVRALHSEAGSQLNVAAASLRLAKTLLLLGDRDELSRLVTEVTGLITPLARYKAATAILADLHRTFAAGQLSVGLLDRLFFDFQKRAKATR